MGKLLNEIVQTGGTIRKRWRVEDKKYLEQKKVVESQDHPLP